MRFTKKTKEAIFIERPNRFQGYVLLDGVRTLCHVPNTGRLREILREGVRCLVRVEADPKRKTAFSLIGAWKGERLINFDSQIPNRVVEEALRERRIPALSSYEVLEREKPFGTSRFDFRLTMPGDRLYFLEVKGVTLEEANAARFPDAVTIRGSRHLQELCEAKNAGHGAGVLFLIQMEGIDSFAPNEAMDPIFAQRLREAKACGVDIFAYGCRVCDDSLTLDEVIPVIL
ncbi:Sugar/maltose fermentation stimulation protein [Clostridiaceae bacterium JG1575]|nr:Sugar/maltose fermentation stimulation protein [Clostridiaceae bacterium JG1575]